MIQRLVSISLLLFVPCCVSALELTGKILDMKTGKPIAKASLVIGKEDAPPIRVLSGKEGEFRVQDLTPGAYMVAVVAVGYLPKALGSPIPQVQGRPLLLDETTVQNAMTIRLIPASSISGRVIDQDGDSLDRATLVLLREVNRSGRKEFLQEAAAAADSEGNFRLANLSPGRYRLLANSNSHTSLPKRFPPTFYGDSVNIAAGREILIRSGDRLTNIDLRMRATQPHSLSGRLIPPAGDDAKMYSVRLVPRDAPLTLLGLLNPQVQYRGSTGEFEADEVPEGDYILQAVREDMHTHEVALRLDMSIYASQKDLLIGPRPLAGLIGKIEMAKGSPTVELDKLKIEVVARDTDLSTTVRPIPVQSDGSFDIRNLSFARYRLSVVDPSGTPLLLDQPDIDLNYEIPNPFVLRVNAALPVLQIQPASSKASVIAVLGGEIHPVKGASVMVRLSPGTHSIVSFEDFDVSLLSDEAFLKKLKPLAQTITVKAGERVALDVPTLSEQAVLDLSHSL
jgi:hypothetical protein